MFEEISKYIVLLGAAQGFLLSIFLFKKKENHLPNTLLTCLMLLFSLDLVHSFIVAGKYYFQYPHLAGFTFGFPYIYGPLIYLFIVVLGSNMKEFPKKYWLHFIPYFVILILATPLFFLRDGAYKISLFEQTATNTVGEIISIIIPFHGMTYAILSVLAVAKFNKKLKNTYSNIEQVNLNWLKHIAFGALIIWIVVVISYSLNNVLTEMNTGLFIYISMSVFIYILGYRSLLQPEIRLIEHTQEINIPGSSSNSVSYKKSGLSEERAEEYTEKLKELFESEYIYRNSDLKLGELATRMGISTHNLSEVINSQMNKSFYDLVNEYRVEEVKKAIKEGRTETFSLISIAFEAGFSSKSSFNQTFKKLTDMTPTQYKNSLSN